MSIVDTCTLAHSVSNAQARGAFYCSATHNLQIWCRTAIIENLNLRSLSWKILCDAPVSDTNYVRSAHVLIVQMTIVCARLLIAATVAAHF